MTQDFMVIDGQQRLATLSILVLAVIAKVTRIATGGTQPDDNLERASALRNRYIGEKDPASLIESSKLFLNRADDPFYQDYLVQGRAPLNPRGLTRSNRLLWECFRYFSKRLDDIPEFENDGAAVAQLATEAVGRQLLFILITVVDRIGNLTLLEPALNRRSANASYSEKVELYAKSKYAITRAVVDRAPTEWSLALVDARQLDLAHRASHVWRVDFA